MLFNSFEFIFLFLPITFLIYFLLGRSVSRKIPIMFLTIASISFYGYWDIRYVPLLLASIVFNYAVGIAIERAGHKKRLLIGGVVANLFLLGYFKYMAFFLTTANTILGSSWNISHIILPLGISFFTFTQIAYLIDAYRGETKHSSFWEYCLFVTIFPHLIAGPIINHRDMIPQFSRLKNFAVDYKNLTFGICLFSMGLFKKVMIADSLAPNVNILFSQAHSLTFVEAWMGAVGYTFQLYFDFSGYSEMAIGLGLMFNLHFPQNFNSPYQAASIIDFWKRWHMTLGAWVKNYLYIPMGGNRQGEGRKMQNLLTAMLLVGLWHGAGWTFVAWGGLHGLYLVVNHQWRRADIHLPKSCCRLLTFLCVAVAWVIFRADSMSDAIAVLQAMANVQSITLPSGGFYEAHLGFLKNYGILFQPWKQGLSFSVMMGGLGGISLLLLYMKNPVCLLGRTNFGWKWCMLTVLFLLLGILNLDKESPFLYFQF